MTHEATLPTCDRAHARWLRLARVLAFLPVGALATGMPYCGQGPCSSVGYAPGARYPDGGLVPASERQPVTRCSGSGPLEPPEISA